MARPHLNAAIGWMIAPPVCARLARPTVQSPGTSRQSPIRRLSYSEPESSATHNFVPTCSGCSRRRLPPSLPSVRAAIPQRGRRLLRWSAAWPRWTRPSSRPPHSSLPTPPAQWASRSHRGVGPALPVRVTPATRSAPESLRRRNHRQVARPARLRTSANTACLQCRGSHHPIPLPSLTILSYPHKAL